VALRTRPTQPAERNAAPNVEPAPRKLTRLGPRRILHVGLSLVQGGTEALVMGAYRRMDREQIQFDFAVAEGPPGPYHDEVRSLGGRVLTYPVPSARRPWVFDRTMRTLLREAGPFAGVHGHVYYLNGPILRAAAAAGVPVRVAHSHFTEDGRGDSLLRRAYRIYSRRLIDRHATHKLGCSRRACESLYGRDCWRDPRTAVIPNGIELERFGGEGIDPAALRREFDLPATATLIGHVGRFVEQKNHRLLIEIFAEAARHRADLALVLVGAGHLQNEIRDRVAELGLTDRVRFLGVRRDLPRILPGLDALLMPSLYEGLPVVLVEAQAAGVPSVVATTITREVDLGAGLVRFVDLGADLAVWREQLFAALGERRRDRAELRALLRSEGYEIGDVAKSLAAVYAP
jgi:glycosyltransferase involved in cell wall biosynthesis